MSQKTGRIAQELMDEPHLEGHRVSVRRIHGMVEERGLEPQSVADKLSLDIADVYRALAYYHDHPGEMHEVEERRGRRIQESLDEGGVASPENL